MNSIDDRLNRIESVIKEESFRKNKGLGNEVSYFIFDYDPKYEIKVRNHVKFLKKRINDHRNSSFKIIEFDLYEIIIEILENKGYLNRSFNLEEKKGFEHAAKAINKSLKLSSESNPVVNFIQDNTTINSVVFLTGVGKSYPLLRSHNILNNLHPINEVPIVLFFPGEYSGSELILFGTIKDNNYYRAFPLIK